MIFFAIARHTPFVIASPSLTVILSVVKNLTTQAGYGVAIPVVLSLCYILGYNWGDYASVAQW